MPCKVLYLSKIVGFKPVYDNTCTDLFRVVDFRISLPDGFKQVQEAVFDVLTAIDADK